VSNEPTEGEPLSGVALGTLSALLRELAASSGGGTAGEADWAMGPLAGERLGRFELLRELGRGGFGVVFEAEDTELHRRVAVKAVRTGARGALRSERLLEEADAAARLAHPNIVTLHDVGRSEHGPYLVLELLEGVSLEAHLRAGPLPPVEAVRIASEVARGLAHAHARGVVHRDLKPANVFLTRSGAVKILDFGLSHAFGHRRVSGGTLAYMAPEQLAGAPEDERTDVFALGVMLYVMLTGQSPFPGTRGQRGAADVAAPSLRVEASPGLGSLVATMLEVDPVRRLRDGSAVLAVLAEVASELGQAAAASRPGSGSEVRVLPPARARAARRLAWGAGAVLVAVVVLLWHPYPGGPGPGAPAHPPGRLLVAVADIENTTGDPELDGTAGMLVTSLEQSPAVEVAPRSRLLDLARPPGVSAAPPRLGVDAVMAAARRLAASAVVTPVVRKLDALYVMEVKVAAVQDGRLLFSLREQERGKENLLAAIDRLSERIRLGLGEPPASVRQSSIVLAATVTASLEAWAAYARGQACIEEEGFFLGYGPCLEHLRRAVAIDPGFALAHLLASEVSFSMGLPRREQRTALEPALRLVDRIPASQRDRVLGWAAFLDGRHLEAAELLAKAAEASAEDKFAWRRAGEVHFHRDEFAEAVPFFRRVNELDPTWVEGNEHLIFALGCTGQTELLRALVERLKALGDDPRAMMGLCWARLWIDPAKALEACEGAISAGAGTAGEQYLAIALLNRGDRDRLRALLGRLGPGSLDSFGPLMSLLLDAQEGRWTGVRRRIAASPRAGAWSRATWTEALVGRGDPALVRAEALATLERDPELVSHVAGQLAYLGDLTGAAEFARFLPTSSPREAIYRAILSWRKGEPGAIGALEAAAGRSALSADPALPHPLFVLGQALVEAGRDREGADALRRFQAMPLTYPSWEYPRSLYYLATAEERLGHVEEAREAARLLLGLWREAGADQPLLEGARAMGTRLGIR
jgi:tetratricopeptide (TPR) repeat protein